MKHEFAPWMVVIGVSLFLLLLASQGVTSLSPLGTWLVLGGGIALLLRVGWSQWKEMD